MSAFGLALLCLAVMCGCSRETEPLVEVKLVKVHHYGDTIGPNGSGFNEPFTHAVYERLDTKERFSSQSILGATGEVFTVHISRIQ